MYLINIKGFRQIRVYSFKILKDYDDYNNDNNNNNGAY